MNDKELIQHYGGPAKLAARLGYLGHAGIARVSAWNSRGIPLKIKHEFPRLFLHKIRGKK